MAGIVIDHFCHRGRRLIDGMNNKQEGRQEGRQAGRKEGSSGPTFLPITSSGALP